MNIKSKILFISHYICDLLHEVHAMTCAFKITSRILNRAIA